MMGMGAGQATSARSRSGRVFLGGEFTQSFPIRRIFITLGV